MVDVNPTDPKDQIYWRGKKLEDLTDAELSERTKNFKMKMKVIYLNIIVQDASSRELNMIQGKPQIDNDPIDKEIKEYLERMFALDEVD